MRYENGDLVRYNAKHHQDKFDGVGIVYNRNEKKKRFQVMWNDGIWVNYHDSDEVLVKIDIENETQLPGHNLKNS